jgi:hypothetical protein
MNQTDENRGWTPQSMGLAPNGDLQSAMAASSEIAAIVAGGRIPTRFLKVGDKIRVKITEHFDGRPRVEVATKSSGVVGTVTRVYNEPLNWDKTPFFLQVSTSQHEWAMNHFAGDTAWVKVETP